MGKFGRGWMVAALLVAAINGSVAAAVEQVDVAQAAAMQQRGALLLDVREVDEYNQAHVPGSVLIPLGQLAQRMKEISAYTTQPVAIICRSGNRSGKALKLLQQAGFSAAVNVEGGMLSWQKAGLPVVTPKP